MTTPTRSAVLATLTNDELFQTAVALSSHIQCIQNIIVTRAHTSEIDHWQVQLDLSLRAHATITAARFAE